MERQVLQIGRHITSLEVPDVVYMKLVGTVDQREVREINGAHLAWGQDVPHLLYLVDLGELDNLPPQVRKEASEVVQRLPLRGTAIYGASLKAKVLAKLMLTAASILRGGRSLNPIEFFDDEDRARVWIEERRKEVSGI